MSDSIPQEIKSPEELKKAYELYCFKKNILKKDKKRIDTYVSFLRFDEKWVMADIAKLLNTSITTIHRMSGGAK